MILDENKADIIQNAIHKLLDLVLNGAYLSNKSKIIYPLNRTIHHNVWSQISQLKKILRTQFDQICSDDLYDVLSCLVRYKNQNFNLNEKESSKKIIVISRVFEEKSYDEISIKPVKGLANYVKDKLKDCLYDAYIHGSLSTKDYTGYSDFDTLFIIKDSQLIDPDNIKKLEKLFIRSKRFLYELDPLQHHGHFFLLEADLKYYNQSFLPLSALKLSTSLLGKGTNLKIHVRHSAEESQERFIESIRLIRRYITADRQRLQYPYYLKGFLSHFMILPALFLQTNGHFVTKKDSFDILKYQIPGQIWQCMEKVSLIRRNWKQESYKGQRELIKIIGLWNPLLLPLYAKYFYKCHPVDESIINNELLNEMYMFANNLIRLSGIDEKRFEIE